MTQNLIELESILTFLGIEFIDYKGKRCSNGHKTAKTMGEIQKYFGKEVMTSGQFIENITWWDFKNDWNDLMFLVEKIEELGANVTIKRMLCEIKYINPLEENQFFEINIASGVKINAINGACLQFINWYNQQNQQPCNQPK